MSCTGSFITAPLGLRPERVRADDTRGPLPYGVGSDASATSDGPGVQLERAFLPRGERGVEDIERVERLDPVNEVVLTEAVQRPHREPAGVDRRALLEQRL